MWWSVLSPLLHLLVLKLVFTSFFGRDSEYYTTYLFAGTLLFTFFKEATNQGMSTLVSNASIISKINLPKYLLLLSKNVSAIINFGLTLILFFIFAALDGVPFTWKFFSLIYPILCLILINLGIGFILSAMYVYFRDTKYLYDIFTLLLHYVSAIFYQVDRYPPQMQKLFLINPIYGCINYFRMVTIGGTIPSFGYHLYLFGYAAVLMGIGCWIYKKNNHTFIYYL